MGGGVHNANLSNARLVEELEREANTGIDSRAWQRQLGFEALARILKNQEKILARLDALAEQRAA